MKPAQPGPFGRNARWLALALLLVALLAVWLEWQFIDLLQLPGEGNIPNR
jgi:hypothetical protein